MLPKNPQSFSLLHFGLQGAGAQYIFDSSTVAYGQGYEYLISREGGGGERGTPGAGRERDAEERAASRSGLALTLRTLFPHRSASVHRLRSS